VIALLNIEDRLTAAQCGGSRLSTNQPQDEMEHIAPEEVKATGASHVVVVPVPHWITA
jgi:hypothetical protein